MYTPPYSVQSFNWMTHWNGNVNEKYTVYPKKYAHGFCFAVLCCGYTLTGFPISIRLTSLALWQSNDCPSASKATLMNMDKYFMWIHYERLHNHNKAKHNKTVCIFLGIYCIMSLMWMSQCLLHYHAPLLSHEEGWMEKCILLIFIKVYWVRSQQLLTNKQYMCSTGRK